MRGRVFRWLNSGETWLYLLGALVVAALRLWPISEWHEVEAYSITSGGFEEIEILYERSIGRTYMGRYEVQIDTVKPRAIACNTTSPDFVFRDNRELPEKITFDWWVDSNPQCSSRFPLPPDFYTTTTTWYVYIFGLKIWPFVRSETLVSNVFEVTEPVPDGQDIQLEQQRQIDNLEQRVESLGAIQMQVDQIQKSQNAIRGVIIDQVNDK